MLRNNIMFVDYETRSFADLPKIGAWRYSEHESTEIIVMCYKLLGSPVVEHWIPGQPIPDLIKNHKGLFCCHNVNFELAISINVLSVVPRMCDPNNWIDTSAMARQSGLPRSLEDVGNVLNLTEQKLDIGKKLIRKFSMPVKKKGHIFFNTPTKEEFEQFLIYCKQDVVVTEKVFLCLSKLSNYDIDYNVFKQDTRVNTQGIPVDMIGLNKILTIINEKKELAEKEALNKFGVNVKSPKQVKDFLKAKGIIVENAQEATITNIYNTTMDPEIKGLCEYRLFLAKASTSKFQSLADRVSPDGYIRQTLVYHGAHTGRWSGKGFQPHNMAKTNTNEQEIEELLKSFSVDTPMADMVLASKKILPGLIQAPPGYKFLFGDFAAIEARGVAFVSGCKVLIDLFKAAGPIYETMAGRIYNKAIADVNKKERQLGKQAILGCGYSMGVKKFIATCDKYKIDVTDSMAEKAVYTYRNTYKEIPELWKKLEYAFKTCFHANPGKAFKVNQYITFERGKSFISVLLPSGRKIYYHKIQKDSRGYSYFNYAQKGRVYVYGGILTENIIQAISRDIMADCMQRLEEAGFDIRFHTHDEVVTMIKDVDVDKQVKVFDHIMNTEPEWLKGFPLKTESEISRRYHK